MSVDPTAPAPGELPADTQAILLLCSGLGTSGEVQPLTPAEYNRLGAWLADNQLRPCNLGAEGILEKVPQSSELPGHERLRALLGRGRLLGLALTKWANFDIWVLSRGDPSYPDRLRRLGAAAPPLLFGAGPTSLLSRGGVAIVGSRDTDDEALAFTRELASRCAEQQVQVISGGARGVDREALTAALQTGGTAVAVPVESLLKMVTERTARGGIREGRLAAVTPYDPELGFTVGRAMGRNKIIYALADYAVVVHFTTGEGGTWGGAVERLRYNSTGLGWVPLFVRRTNNPDDGLRQLETLGAHQFPDDFRKEPIVDILARRVSTPTGLFDATPASPPADRLPGAEGQNTPPQIEVKAAPPATTPPVPTGSLPPSSADTCYNRCLGLLLTELRAEPTKKQLSEIAKRLDLVPQQLNKWLERALAEGQVAKKRKGRKVVFVDTSLADQGTLFGQE